MGGFQYCCFEDKKTRERNNNLIRLTNNKIINQDSNNTSFNLLNYQKKRRPSAETDNSKNNSDDQLTNKDRKKKKNKKFENQKNEETSNNYAFNKQKKNKKNKSSSVDCPNPKLLRKKTFDGSKENTKNNGILNKEDFKKGILIGEGRFGKVYSGLSSNGKIIIIKAFTKITNSQKKEIIKNLNDIYKLNHINIIRAIPSPNNNIYDENGDLCLVYESINSKNVRQIIQNFGNLDEKIIQIYIKQLLEGLKYLHENKVYHKNLKPNNIFVDNDGTIKISDCLVDNLILGNAKNIYNIFLESEQIDYYIPPFFIQAIKSNEQNNKTNEEINNMDKLSEISKNIFDDWKSYDLWYLGCLIIEVSSGKNPWCHYNFKNNSAFFDFLANTHLSPTLPKKLSSQCKELLKILLNHEVTKRDDIYDIILGLDFFKKDTNNFTYNRSNIIDLKSSLNDDSQMLSLQNESSNFNANDALRSDSTTQLGQILANNKVVNILNNNNNASFSVSYTVEDSSISLTQSYVNNKLNQSINKLSQSQISRGKNINIKVNKIQNNMPRVEEAQIEQSPEPVKNEEQNNFKFPNNQNI